MAVDREEEDFPGLNKRHGFFRAIERNQHARDSFHWQQEEQKEACQSWVMIVAGM